MKEMLIGVAGTLFVMALGGLLTWVLLSIWEKLIAGPLRRRPL